MARLTKGPAIYGLFIGINNYPGTGLDLAGCVNDAQDWADAVSPVCKEVVMLLDGQATKSNILDSARNLLDKLQVGDRLVATYSGHGTWKPDLDGDEPDGRDECLVPHDYQNLISDDEIYLLLLDRQKGSQVFFASDSCNSGTVYRMLNPAPEADDKPPMIRFIDPSRLHLTDAEQGQGELYARRVRASQLLIGPGLIHFAGCQDTEYCYDASFQQRPNGAFTYFALRALKESRRGVNFSTWMNKIRSLYLPSYQYPQAPRMNAGFNESRLDVFWKV